MMRRKAAANRVLDKYFAGKEENKTLGCHVVAWAPLGENSAKVVVSAASPIDLATIREFIFAVADRKLIPNNETYIQNKHEGGMFYASIITYRSPVEHKPIDEMPKATQISANAYLDEELGQIWEKAEVEGKQYFVKKNTEDIEDILKQVTYTTASAYVTASHSIDSFTPVVLTGNFVEFFTLDEKCIPGKAIGQVTKIEENSLEVKVGNLVVSAPVPIHAVLKVVAEPGLTTIEDVISYLRKAYPNDYVSRVSLMK